MQLAATKSSIRKIAWLASKTKWHFIKQLDNPPQLLENLNSVLIVFHLLQWNLKDALVLPYCSYQG